MDFLYPDKKRAHRRKLLIGYILVAIFITMATVILVFEASGYSVDKHGQVYQNGLVFVSSQPNGARIYLNGVLNSAKTNTRLNLPAGQYTMVIKQDGYRNWQRALGVEGGSVERFDYPFLFPTSLQTSTVKQYASQPGLVTQSPDRRWLLVDPEPASNSFDLYDLNNRKQPSTAVVLPDGILSAPATTGWQLVEWSNDNRHVLLNRQFTGGSEYVLLDIQVPTSSLSLTNTLALTPTEKLSLRNKAYNQYFVFDTTTETLGTDSLSTAAIAPLLTHVLAFKSFGTNVIVYATDKGAPSGKTVLRLDQAGTDVALRTVVSGSPYMLNIAQYSGVWYVAVGAAAEDRVYIYKDPVGAITSAPDQPLVPLDILKVTEPNFLQFSANTQFIVAENGPDFAVYDIQNDKAYTYQLTVPLDASAVASWMDGDRLMLTSNGKVVVFDYDDANQQTLMPTQTDLPVFFDRDYTYVYAEAPAASSGTVSLTRTALTDPAKP